MMQRIYRITISLIMIFVTGLLLFSCTNSIEPSPDPGRLRIILQHDPADTLVEIATYTIPLDPRDLMWVNIFQGKAYMDSTYFILYENTETSFAGENYYNMFERNEDGELIEHPIFDSFLPPDHFTSIQFGISAIYMLLTYGYAYGGIRIPMESPEGVSRLVTIDQDFTIQENKVTEIKLFLKSFQSVTRYRDMFHFIPKFEVISVSIE